MSFGTFNSTKLNTAFLAGTLWLSASALGASEIAGANNTLRYLESPVYAEAFTDGFGRVVLGYQYGNRFNDWGLNNAPIHDGHYIWNAVFASGQATNAEAYGSDNLAVRLGKSAGYTQADALSTGAMYSESLVSGTSNAVSYTGSAAEHVFTASVRLQYVGGFTTAVASSRGFPNEITGLGAALPTASSEGTAFKTKTLYGASAVCEVLASTVPTWITAHRSGAVAESYSTGSPDVTRGNVRYATATATSVCTSETTGDALRLARTSPITLAECFSQGSGNRARSHYALGTLAEAVTSKPSTYRERLLSVQPSVTESLATGEAERFTKPTASIVANSGFTDTAVRLGVAEGGSISHGETDSDPTRLGKATGNIVVEAVAYGDAIRYANAFGDIDSESELNRLSLLRYANAFGEANAGAQSTDTAIRLAVSDGNQTAEGQSDDTAVRFGVLTGDTASSVSMGDSAIRFAKPLGAVRAHAPYGINEGLFNQSVIFDNGYRRKLSGWAGSHLEGLRYANAFGEANAGAQSTGDMTRVGKPTGDSDCHGVFNAFITRVVYGHSAGFTTALSYAAVVRTVLFNRPVYAYTDGRFYNEHPLNSRVLFDAGYRVNPLAQAFGGAQARLNVNMQGTPGRIYNIPGNETRYLLPTDDRTYKL